MTEPTKSAAELLREAAKADPEAHKRALGHGYGGDRMTPSDAQLAEIETLIGAERGPFLPGSIYRHMTDLIAALRDARAETAELRARIEALLFEGAGMAMRPFNDGERYFAERDLRAALSPAEEADEYVRGVHQNGETWRVRRDPEPK